MINVNQITTELARMPDPMLQKYAALHKDDPYTVSLALSESNRRKAIRAGAAPNPGQMPSVVDQDIAQMAAPVPQMPMQAPQPAAQQQLPENTGIGQLPAQNMQHMADGGIVGYADTGAVNDISAYIRQRAAEMGMDPDLAMRLFGTESGLNPNAESNKGAVGLGQLRSAASKEMGLSPAERKDPRKNVDASIAYFLKQKARFGDDTKAAAAYNWGPQNLTNHLEKNNGQLNPVGLPKETANYLTKLFPAGTAAAATTADKAPTTTTPTTTTPPAATEDRRAWYDRYRDLMTSGEGQKAMLHGVQDVPSSLAGAPVDLSYYIANKLGRTPVAGEKPVMGSKWIQEKLGNMGLRAADSANPDVQNIREATTGIAGLYNPVGKAEAAETAAQAIARRQAAEAAAAEAKVANPRLVGPTTDTTMVQAPGYAPVINGRAVAAQVADKEKAAAEAAKAAQLSQAAKEAGGARQFTNAINPLGVAAAAPLADQGISALTTSNKGLPMSDLGFDTSGLDALNKKDKDEIKDVAKEVLPNKGKDFSNDMLLMLGLNMMAGQSPNFLTNVGQAGISTLKYGQEAKKEEAEQAYKEALAKHYGVPGEVQMLEYLKTPANMKAYMQQREAMREPMTREALFKQFMTSNQGMIAKPEEIGPMFQNYVKSYESVMGPIGGLPAGTKVTRIP